LRRKFWEALKLHPEDPVAMGIVARTDELFSVDAESRTTNLDHASHHSLRLEWLRPFLDLLKGQIEAARRDALPASALGRAVQYTLTL
jgi:transposase